MGLATAITLRHLGQKTNNSFAASYSILILSDSPLRLQGCLSDNLSIQTEGGSGDGVGGGVGMEGRQTDRPTGRQTDPSVTPVLPTGVVRTHQGSECPSPLGEVPSSRGSPTCGRLSPGGARAWTPTPPARARRVPAPDVCPREELRLARALPVHLATLRRTGLRLGL